MLSGGVLGRWWRLGQQILVDYNVILMLQSVKLLMVLKCQNSTFASLQKRSLQTVESDAKRFADPGFLSTFYALFCVDSIRNRFK